MTVAPHPASYFRYRTYQPHSVIEPHEHSSASMTVLLAGRYEERIDGRVQEHRQNSVLICPAGMPHAQTFGRTGARKIIVEPDANLLDYLQATLPFASAPSACSTLTGQLARQIDTERRLDDDFSQAAIEGVLWQIAATMGRELARSAAPLSQVAQRATRILNEQAGENFTLAALSREAKCHPSTLVRAFGREHGCGPGRYQRNLRIERAAHMLRETTVPLAEVAATCGFCDQSHLARSFRAAMGCTPSQYRGRA